MLHQKLAGNYLVLDAIRARIHPTILAKASIKAKYTLIETKIAFGGNGGPNRTHLLRESKHYSRD